MTEDITGRNNSLLPITLTMSGVHWVSKFLMGLHTKSQTITPLCVYRNTDLLLAADEGHGGNGSGIKVPASNAQDTSGILRILTERQAETLSQNKGWKVPDT